MKYKQNIEDYDEDGDDEAHEKLTANADWNGPVEGEERHCTDLLCLFLLCVAWVAMTWVGIYAVNNGDYRLILNPLDYDGNVCGVNFGNVDMTEYPYLYYINSYTGGVCVKECPSLQGKTADNLTDIRTLITYNGTWQTEDGLAELPLDFVQVADYSTSDDALACSTEDCFPNNDSSDSWTSPGISRGFGYAYYVGDTYELLLRCYLTSAAETRISELTSGDDGDDGDSGKKPLNLINYYDTNALITNLYGDLFTARYYILAFGFACSLVVSLVYMLLLRIPCLLTSLVWFSIFSIIALFAGAGWFAQVTADDWEQEDPPTVRAEQIDYTRYASYVAFGISAILALLGCCLRSQIQLAISCVMQAGAAVNRMVVLFLIPVMQGIAFLIFWVVWAYFAVHLASLGNITTQSFPVDLQGTEVTIRVFEFDDFVTQCGWYLLFCFFWTASFIVAVGDMVVAMAISKWYFTVDKSNINSLTVVNSLVTTLVYHLGTCAYGSLIIAIIKLIRAMLAKFQKQIANATNKSVASCLLCCCICCMCVLERCMKFINKNAYIQCAIFGTPFCVSGRKAFFLILRNAARIGAVSYVSAAVLIIGKLFISSLTTATAYFCLVEYLEVDLYSYSGPVVLIFVISYFVADMFMDVFEIGILTILHCFVADEEMFDGRARYAEGSLTTWIDRNGGSNDSGNNNS